MNKEALRIHLEAIMNSTPKESWVDNLIVFISVNFPVMRSVCWNCGKDIKYHENGKPHWRCECGAENPANDA